MKISKTYTFDAAHQLVGHEGKCKNLHGHTYYVTVGLEGEQIQNRAASNDTMVMDYGDLDKIVEPVIEQLDHAFLYGDVDSEGRLLLLVLDLNLKRCWVGTRSTAEEICFFIWNAVAYRMTAGTSLVVIVSETPKTSASYAGIVGGVL